MRYVGALACFALIRRWRDTFPTQGEGYFWLLVIVRYSADLPVK